MMLDASGIHCMIKNEKGSCIVGEGLPIPGNPTLSWSWPEVWVNDEDYENALPLADDFRESAEKSEKGIQQSPTSADSEK
jgi:hypothetical protein